MAKKKRKYTRKTTNKRNSNSTGRVQSKDRNGFSIDVAVIFMVIISFLLMVLIYSKSGALGEILSPCLGGIMGWIKYIIPFGTLGIAICIAKEDKDYLTSKIIQYVIMLACLSATLTIYQCSTGALNVDIEFEKAIEIAYQMGERNIGGGTIGAIIGIPLIKLFGQFGAAIITVGIASILIVFTFGISPSELIQNLFGTMAIKKANRNSYEEDDEIEDEEFYDSRAAQKMQKRAELKKQKMERAAAKSFERQKATQQAEKSKRKSSIDIPLDDDGPTQSRLETEDIQFNLNIDEQSDDVNKSKEKGITKLFGRKVEEKQEPKMHNPNEIEANLFEQKEVEKESKTKQVLQLEHSSIVLEDENYEYPPTELMKQGTGLTSRGSKKALADTATKLQKTLYSFGVSAKVENVSVGPAITRYELKPAEGVRISKISKLSDDIALNLAAETIRIEAPIPGKQAVGIEIPNQEKEVVHLRDIIESSEFNGKDSNLAFALGKDIGGENIVTDIAKMPHLLIAGSTGSGKSVCINTLITSILYKAKPSEVKLLMVDPKVVELSVYNGIPHLLIPVVTDPKKAAGALAWAVQEMVHRYSLFAEKGVRDIKGYNAVIDGETEGKLPQIVIIIDELADLMMVAPNDVEDAICRLAQMARAAGMHLVIATQRPSVDVITGIIKANIPSRIAFAVSSQVDSRTILDMAGAEKLLGKGDMLFYPVGVPKPIRIQGAFVSDQEIERIVGFLKSNGNVVYNEDIIDKIEKANSTDQELEEDKDDDTDPFLMEAIDTVVEVGQASTSFIQRRFKVGYARAGRIIDQMEARGIISGYEGSKPRQVLITKERLAELKMEKDVKKMKESEDQMPEDENVAQE